MTSLAVSVYFSRMEMEGYIMPKKHRTVTMRFRECLRCLHEWLPKKIGKPIRCPRCGSPYWDRPRTQENAGGRPEVVSKAGG